MIVIFRLMLAAGLLLTSTARPEEQRFEYSADSMGGAFSIVLYSAGRPAADAAAEAAFAELRRLDGMLSNYRQESEWSEINRFAADRAVNVSGELFDLLSACLAYSRQSDGAFDITVGPLMKVWKFYDGSGRLAEDAAVREALLRVGYRNVLLDAVNHAVRFARPGVEIDPGGIGKGYAVDRMIMELRRKGIERALISAAGSSIYAMGTPPGEAGWPVRINDRNAPAASAGDLRLPLRDESVSTSGVSIKHFRSGGRDFGHIMDPRTGNPVRGTLLVSVVAPRTIDSEAWTKAYFVNGRAWSVHHIPQGFRVFFCEDEAGRPVCGWLNGPHGSESSPP